MSTAARWTMVVGSWLLAAGAAAQELQVTSSGPRGEVASRAEANEVRVVFSEPMVVLGRIPDPVTVSFFRIEPAVEGSFRWSGTRTLIFTPADPEKLPWATRFTVTIGPEATSVSGHRLGQPHTFSFTTPTLRLLRTEWYRKGGRFDAPVVVGLRFNQPVDPAALAPRVSLALEPHDFVAPAPPDERALAVDPAARADFDAKVARASAAANATGPVPAAPAASFDEKRLRPGDDLLVLETETVPPSESWLRVRIDPAARGRQGQQTPGKPQTYTIRLERTFFVDGLRCSHACDPDSWNPVNLRGPASARSFRARTRVVDVTNPASPQPLEKKPAPDGDDEDGHDRSSSLTLQDAGYTLRPAHTYEVIVGPGLTATDGQTLGYTWAGTLENWHQRAFTSFGSGHGVWERSGGAKLPFYARNLQNLTQWVAPLGVEELMPTLRRVQEKYFELLPPGPGTPRALTPKPDAIQSWGIDLSSVLDADGTGLVWAGVKDGQPIPRAHHDSTDPRSTLVQVTGLGLSVKDSPHGSLVLVTRLADAQPVEGAAVAIRNLDNVVLWTGTTDASGIALAPALPLRGESSWEFRFVVTAEKDGDVAYVGSDWNEGTQAWWFDGIDFDLSEAKPLLRGVVFADRGVYKLGEEIHLKTILRSDTAAGMGLFPTGTPVKIVVRDSHGNDVDTRTVGLNGWSGADWTYTLPASAPLGSWQVLASIEGQSREVEGSFLVAAYRRPDFRVDADLQGESSVAGVELTGVVTGRYLFGAPMAGRDVRWTFSKTALRTAPAAVLDRFPSERWVTSDEEGPTRFQNETVQSDEVELDEAGSLELTLATDRAAGIPVQYVLEGEVTDVSRQTIAGRTSIRIEPADVVVGFRRPGYFIDAGKGLDTEVIATSLAGEARAGVPVELTLTQVQWHSVRRAEGNGYYTWETERREVPAGTWEVTSGNEPAPLHLDLPSGGYFVLKATAEDAEGRTTTAVGSFYALGAGYTAWERYDHNRIDLVPEKTTWRPGETARILVKSPWETATALLTTEREGIRSHRVFTLTSTQSTVEVPVTARDIPNLYVSVLLLKGRTSEFTTEDASDPGKPAFRLGYVELRVEDASKRLDVAVATDREEYRPASKARVDVTVTGPQGHAAHAEVTLWAVDYGVLSLTAYRTPDVSSAVWVEKALQVMNLDSRQNIISRRVLVSKGADEGGGGGMDSGPGDQVRKDFRVLAFWLGSVTTDAKGRASAQVTLPESLTTYRVMAVAQDEANRFGAGEREIRTSKPVLLKPAFPRFLSTGDETLFGSVVHSQLADGGKAIVTLRSLDPTILEVAGDARQTVEMKPRSAQEVRFRLRARSTGTARLQMTVKLKGETDAFEDVIPVRVPTSPETVAAYGQTTTSSRETIEVPAGVAPGYGGLHVQTASTALVGLGEGARYLVEYPYGCAEQRASAALALMLASDLGEAFRLPGLDPGRMRESAAATLLELEAFQCDGGGFAYWKGDCRTVSPYLTSWVTHVYQRGKALNYGVKDRVLQDAYGYLEGVLAEPRPVNEGWWPGYTAWQAFAVKVLVEGRRNEDSHLTRLHQYLDRMPVFALDFLLDALTAKGETGPRVEELERRIRNAVLPEGGTAHVEELSDPHLLWFWNSNVRSTAITLSTLVRRPGNDELAPAMARWLLQARVKGRWGNTQENAYAMAALVDYYRALEKDVPDFGTRVTLDGEVVFAPEFRGRSAEAQTKDVPMAELVRRAKDDGELDLELAKEGAGTLHWMARLRYATSDLPASGRDMGIHVERRYERAALPGAAPAAETSSEPPTSFEAGQLVRVTLTVRVPKERRYVAVTDPLPAGFEPVETWFATTAADIAREQQGDDEQDKTWWDWFERGGFDHVERHDDRVQLFATRLAEGEHVFSYVVRATTAGTFRTGATHAEEMYSPEVFGRTPGTTVTVRP